MALNSWGLQCLTWGLTGAGIIILSMVLVIGLARLLSESISLPDEDI
jgi:hypothetical protein